MRDAKFYLIEMQNWVAERSCHLNLFFTNPKTQLGSTIATDNTYKPVLGLPRREFQQYALGVLLTIFTKQVSTTNVRSIQVDPAKIAKV